MSTGLKPMLAAGRTLYLYPASMVGYLHYKSGGYMTEKWSDELPDDAFLSEAEKTYMNALVKIKQGLAKGFDFVSASAAVRIDDEPLRQAVFDDVLKVIIAEAHFVKEVPLEQIGKQLNLPIDRLEKARSEMLEDVEKTTVNAFYNANEKGTEH
jgi:hypothetical protein